MADFLLRPIDEQYDGGFGLTAHAFLDAADNLRKSGEGSRSVLNGHLPINFLYRHSIELFLKSMIIVISRKLGLIEFDPKDPGGLSLVVAGKVRPLRTVHAIMPLFLHYKEIVTSNRPKIMAIARTDWSEIPSELELWLEEIEGVDGSGTRFRYPWGSATDSDHDKSSFKRVDIGDLEIRIRGEGPPVMAMLVKNDQGEIVSAYVHDESVMGKTRSALAEAAGALKGAHYGIRVEFAGGR